MSVPGVLAGGVRGLRAAADHRGAQVDHDRSDTSNARIDTDPGLVTRFTAAVNESLRYADDHPDEVRNVVGTYTKISDSVRTSMILPVWPLTINRPSLERLAVLGRQDGMFVKPPALDELLPPV